MQGIEALERVITFYSKRIEDFRTLTIKYISPLQEEFDIIKQDLERLEKLEKENESLKRGRDKIIKTVKDYALKQESLTDYLLQENFDLQQKTLELETKNAKLENAIKILKDKLKLFWFEYKVIKAENPIVELTKEEYEAINEAVEASN